MIRKRGFGWADVIGPTGIALVVATVCLWIFNAGLARFADVHRVFGSIGLLTGLLSSILMILQVLLLARIPWVERAWGHDLLAHRHRWLGFWSFWLMIVHVIAFAIDRCRTNPTTAVDALLDVFVRDPWMLWATVGTALIVVVVVTSIRYARARMRYESWHLLHLYAYLGMAFALPHQIADGADFHGIVAQVYWWGLYAFALIVTIVFRILVPVYRSLYHQLRVVGVTEEGPGVVSVRMRGRHLDRLNPRSGQFFIWRFLDGPGWTRGNPYTLSDAPDGTHLRVTIQASGQGSARVADLKPGTRVAIEGPYGTMTVERRLHDRLLFMAAGVGITPLRALIGEFTYTPGTATLIYRYTSDEHAIFVDELELLAAERGLRVIYLPGGRRDDGSWLPAGYTAADDEALEELVPAVREHDVFICGPPAWVRAVKRAAQRAGAARHQIHSEDFAW
ncbi:MAG: Respiratory burst oxidase-like protein [Mycobacterium sp.]|nr:Respiratory burst oxidase-like protein [Mycobacterium sp.]